MDSTRNTLQKNKDVIMKYVAIVINLIYIISLGISSIVLGNSKVTPELAYSFAPSVISIVCGILTQTPENDILRLTEKMKLVMGETGDRVIIEKCISEIASHADILTTRTEDTRPEEDTSPIAPPAVASVESREIPVSEPVDDHVVVMNAYYDKRTGDVRCTPRRDVPPLFLKK